MFSENHHQLEELLLKKYKDFYLQHREIYYSEDDQFKSKVDELWKKIQETFPLPSIVQQQLYCHFIISKNIDNQLELAGPHAAVYPIINDFKEINENQVLSGN